MRRRLAPILPVFLLALLVQVLAPIGASLAMGAAASNASIAFPICGHSDPSQPLDGHHTGADDCCILCGLAQLAAPLVGDISGSGLAYSVPQWSPAAYRRDSSETGSSRHSGLAGRPRAPPAVAL